MREAHSLDEGCASELMFLGFDLHPRLVLEYEEGKS